MRCLCCNASLSDYEVTIRHAITKQFVELCSVCLKDSGIPVQIRPDLIGEVDTALEDLVDDYEGLVEDDFEDDYYKDMWDER
jgi:hypothetical protein